MLGLGGSNHDFSAAIVNGGEIVVAIEDERLQRVKRGRNEWHARPAEEATAYCLSAAGLDLADLEGVFCCDDLERPHPWLDWSDVQFVNHHTCHAAAAFYTSPFDEATLLVIDGHGSPIDETVDGYVVETVSAGSAGPEHFALETLEHGTQRRTSSSWRYVSQNSIGWFYKIVTMALGFGAAGQGKMMGLAAFGTDRFVGPLSEFVEFGEGRFKFDPYGGIWDWLTDQLQQSQNQTEVRSDIAFAAQEILVDAVVRTANTAYQRFPSPTLCFGGGCALNSLANSRILADTPFERLWIFPAAGDGGLAVGAAFYGSHRILGVDRPARHRFSFGRAVYTGRKYSSFEVDTAIGKRSVVSSRPDDLVVEVASALVDSATVAMWQGGSEIGPRALGHRSLLALPASAAMRDHINLNIKHRESFRPLAPVVPIEHVHEYFENIDESPYMLLVGTVCSTFRRQLAAVTHIDGTARVQTVRQEDNPFLHRLLIEVGERCGLPVLLNTSLNGPGEPIVESPLEALDLYINRPIDLLVLDDALVRKFTPWVSTDALSAAR